MYVSIYIHAGASDAADIHKNDVDIDVYADVYVRVHNTHVDVYLGCTLVCILISFCVGGESACSRAKRRESVHIHIRGLIIKGTPLRSLVRFM